MFVSELISSAIPTLSRADKVSQALEMMNTYHTNVLPVVENENYLGLMDESALLETNSSETHLDQVPLSALKPAIHPDAHLFEAIKLVGDYQLGLLPVVKDESRYIGSITPEKLLSALSHFNSIHHSGGLLILKMAPADYMLSEIARLAEAHDIFLLGVHTITEPGSNTLKIVLKTNRKTLTSFATTLQHLNYNVIYRIDETESAEDLRKNYDLLMNYINM